ncbi:iron complex outermembrane receptor protein [Prosthecobacter fusiformis]|uniref:Iron complex outermembrane receptor protein n=1 Tax=Prosthecobacter fusiformis TaxID=48464 RepID=A0A4R7RT36_9BACT|nr:TonB-dependent receptor [Prosthecobacter fusiformis]TDU68128.1 iron complex outermembrane receptor protein [Prosthecobacter fusiformis]
MLPPTNLRYHILAVLGLLASTVPFSTFGQEAAGQQTENQATSEALPEVVISAPKLGKDLLKLPLSATITTGEVIDQNALRTVKDAAQYSPNTYFSEFSARKLSSPRFRGLFGSPNNPGVTTYYDGVPQFNGNSSSLELLDVEQIDFVRGPAGALFGRNTVGGLVNVTSRRPSLDSFEGEFETTFGSYNLYDVRGRVSGPLVKDQLGFSFAGGHNERDGYTENTLTGHDLDNRSSSFGKAQFLWAPSEKLEVRFILAGETADDGDYGLSDLGGLRRDPRKSARDFEGYTSRDVLLPTLQVTYHAKAFDFTSTTGFVWWDTEDKTDLDYSAGPIPAVGFPGGLPSFLVRYNHEQQTTWTQEFRFSNPLDKPVVLSETATLAWQAGLFLFHQQYDQQTVQDAAALGGGFIPANTTRTNTGLTDMGIGAYLQSTLTLWEKLNLTAGVRWDYEDKEADLRTNRTPVAVPFLPNINSSKSLTNSYSQITPQAAISYDITPDTLAYFSFAGGYKAGGFNTAANDGIESYDEEKSWNYELGLKGRAMEDRLSYNLALFYTDWTDLQLNTPSANSPAQFDITNAGSASSKGIELGLNFRPVNGWDLFGSAGWQDVKFQSGSTDGGTDISGNKVPFTPDYTVTVGSQFSWNVGRGYSAYVRGDVQFIGAFDYDSINGAGQDAYTLANFRVGVRHQSWFIEGFVNNAFDTEYVPMAIPFGGGVAPSGYLGESGAPITFGVRVGVKF